VTGDGVGVDVVVLLVDVEVKELHDGVSVTAVLLLLLLYDVGIKEELGEVVDAIGKLDVVQNVVVAVVIGAYPEGQAKLNDAQAATTAISERNDYSQCRKERLKEKERSQPDGRITASFCSLRGRVHG
jgi:hypothetical protein